MSKLNTGAIFGAAMLISGGAFAGELQNATVESVDTEANTVTIQGVTYQAGEDVGLVGLQPGMQVHIWFEEEGDEPVLTKYEPEGE